MLTHVDPAQTLEFLPPDAPLRAVIETVVGPLAAADGGTIRYVKREGSVVWVALGGRYSGCPGTRHTLQFVVLPALRRVDASLLDVRATRG